MIEFIEDVIYGLKHEYGSRIVIKTKLLTLDVETGIEAGSSSSFLIPLAIPLPLNLRQAFLRSIGIQKAGYLEDGERQFLIDKSDIPSGKAIKLNDFLIYNSIEYQISKDLEDYESACIVTCKIPNY